MPNKITATFEVTTPLFLGGVDPASSVELRAPSIKGALRFWWRALAWGRLGGDLDKLLGKLRRKEQEVFGAAGDDRGALGQSTFSLRARWFSEPPIAQDGLTSGKPGLSYLGYGVLNRGRGNPPRPCFEPTGSFELSLQSLKRSRVASAEPAESETGLCPTLLDALKLFGLLGGLGGRSRRGWGSLTLTEVEADGGARRWRAPQTLDEYKGALSAILGEAAEAPNAPYSAFAKGARLSILGAPTGVDALTALDQLGQAYQAFRREPDNRSFIFGLPHPRYRGRADRRASPLLLHVHKLKDQYAIAITFLRAPFLEGEPHWPEYRKIEDFLDKLPATLKPKGFAGPLSVLDGGPTA
jgi:CRISPR-associated protein Cmr1